MIPIRASKFVPSDKKCKIGSFAIMLLQGIAFHLPESKMLLRKIAESNDDSDSKTLGNCGIKMHVLNKYVQYSVIQKKVDSHYQHIPDQLDVAAQIRTAEHDVFIK